MTPEEAKKYISRLSLEEKVRLDILLRVIETSRQNYETGKLTNSQFIAACVERLRMEAE